MVKRTKVLPLAVAIVAIVLAYLSYLGPEEAVFRLSDLLNSLDTGAEENTKYNKFLQGNYAPVADEMLDIPLSLVSGELPQDLSGLFLRVGKAIACYCRRL